MEKNEFEEYQKKVIEIYEKKYLKPTLGNSSFKENLLEGLVKSFEISRISKDSSKEYLFSPLEVNRNSPLSTRAILSLRAQKVTSLADIPKKVYKENYLNLNSPYLQKLDNEGKYKAFLFKFRNMGKKTVEEIINYLKSNDFDFSEDFAKKISMMD